MCTSHNHSTPKRYNIQYKNQSYRKIYNAIFGRANKPYAFRFLEITPNNYLLVREKDNLILCTCEGELSLSTSFEKHTPLIIQPIEVKKGFFALVVQNQSPQQYICYDGYVLHEYYAGLKTVNSLLEAAVWSIQEVQNISPSIIENHHFSLN